MRFYTEEDLKKREQEARTAVAFELEGKYNKGVWRLVNAFTAMVPLLTLAGVGWLILQGMKIYHDCQ